MRTLLWVLAAALTVALAGCTADGHADHPDADSYTLTVSDMPSTATAGEAFTFTLVATGEPASSSEHIGGHYWSQAPADPTAGLSDALGCDHLDGAQDTPGTYTVTCTIDTEGDWHVYGHLRLVHDEENLDFWAAPHVVSVTA